MTTLSRELRRSLENTVREARRTAEAGARKVIEQLAVHHHEPWPSMTPAQRELRNRLRAHGRQLGDRRDEQRALQAIDRLTSECAYEHWHRLLFARFLAETELLIEPQSGIAITLAECEELARDAGRDWLEVAAEFAQRMLPQIFRNGDPVLEVALLPETRSALEDLMKALQGEVFVADDSLGWVYQYWQADRKEAINHSEKKIGADELPAVTQLFTEDYMVLFLLHNTLGAWWAGKVLAANPALAATAGDEDALRTACAADGVEWTYLRFVREGDQLWRPAAGVFDGWPKATKDITLLDPCMGSGHFLVFALPILAALRAAEEGLTSETATVAVLRDNLFGLEIDPRCTQIAAFNLALAAWRRVGYRALPTLHLACSGLSLGVNKAEWLKLAEQASELANPVHQSDSSGLDETLIKSAFTARARRGLERLYDLFAKAPTLGSLIDPYGAGGDLVEAGFQELEPVMSSILAAAKTEDVAEMAVSAQGMAKAAELLGRQFTLVATNVPYLGRKRQDDVLRSYCDEHHEAAKPDLATCFVERVSNFCQPGGASALVFLQNALFLRAYRSFRHKLLRDATWNVCVKLGARGFQTPMYDFGVTLSILQRLKPSPASHIYASDVGTMRDADRKARYLATGPTALIPQHAQLSNPDYAIVFGEQSGLPLLEMYADSYQGASTLDIERFRLSFWETGGAEGWVLHQSTPVAGPLHSGCKFVSISREPGGAFWELADRLKEEKKLGGALSGRPAWGKVGVAVSWMGTLPACLYTGAVFDNSIAVLLPKDEEHTLPIYCFVSSDEYGGEVRKINQKTQVANATLVKVPFDLERWQEVAAERFPAGLPTAHSSDPTQWLFNGHPRASESPLQVAVARLLGFRWPRQRGSSLPGCPALGVDELETHADRDGVVSLSAVKGEQAAAGRLAALLSEAFGTDWSAARLNGMLSQVGFAGRTLDDWLREGFFDQHCALFNQRPFIWHVWDGRPDGFHALVNYHRLAAPGGEGRRTLEKLLYSYLGDWIDQQRADQKAGIEGADARVAAAEQLKTELASILAGEPPYDLFVRWKPLFDQPIGWEPDINDGVLVNIRPFMAAKPMGARVKGACILRTAPKVKWEKDRGKEPLRPRDDFPWFWGWDERTENFEGSKAFDGNRWTDLHYTRAFKEDARTRRKR